MNEEIRISKALLWCFVPEAAALWLVFRALVSGDDGAAYLISAFFPVEPAYFIPIIVCQHYYKKRYIDSGMESKNFFQAYSIAQVVIGCIILCLTYHSESPHWLVYELYSRLLFWFAIGNVTAGVVSLLGMSGKLEQ